MKIESENYSDSNLTGEFKKPESSDNPVDGNETNEDKPISDNRPDIEHIIANSEYRQILIQKLNLIDDVFFSEVMKQSEACEYLLSEIIEKPIKIKRLEGKPQNFVQYAIRNLDGHSVCLDVIAEDDKGQLYNIEMQKTNNDDIARRLRMNGSLMDCRMLEKGVKYRQLPETYIICITEFCMFKSKEVRHEVKSFMNGDPEQPYNNGVHIIFANTLYSDNSHLSKVMAYFKNSDPEVTSFGALSETVAKIKNPVKEGNIMSEGFRKAVEAIYSETCADVRKADRAEGKAEGIVEGKTEAKVFLIKRLLEKSYTLSEALELADLDEATYKKYKQGTCD